MTTHSMRNASFSSRLLTSPQSLYDGVRPREEAVYDAGSLTTSIEGQEGKETMISEHILAAGSRSYS